MKLKFLIRLNALLLICSLALNILAKEGSLEMDIKKFTVKKLKNPKLKETDKLAGQVNQFSKCNIKTGILNYLSSKNEAQRELTFQPVFVQLNKVSLNLYDSFNTGSSLMATINLDRLARIIEIYQGTHCLTFVMKLENNAEQEGITVCPNNLVEKEEWLNSITEFKECDIQVEKGEINEKVLLDFSKINYLLTLKNKTDSNSALLGEKMSRNSRLLGGKRYSGPFGSASSQEAQEEEMFGLYYDNTNKVLRTKPSTLIQNTEMRREVKGILEEIQLGNLAQKQIQRQMIGKINNAERIKNEVEEQKHIVREIMQRRAEKEKEAKDLLFQKATQNKEIQLMKAVKLQIEKIKKEEIKETKETLKKQLEAVRGATNRKIATSLGDAMRKSGGIFGSHTESTRGQFGGVSADGRQNIAGGMSGLAGLTGVSTIPGLTGASNTPGVSGMPGSKSATSTSKQDRRLKDFGVCYNKDDLLGNNVLI